MRKYDTPVTNSDIFMGAEDFEKSLKEEKETGYTILPFGNYDGQGYWVKDGMESNDEIFSTPRLDATHITWYNK